MKRILLLSFILTTFNAHSAFPCSDEDAEKAVIDSIVGLHQEVSNLKAGVVEDGIKKVYEVFLSYDSRDVMPDGTILELEMVSFARVDTATCEILEESGLSVSPKVL